MAYSGNTATFTLAVSFGSTTTYTATMTTGAKNPARIALPSDAVWAFTTGGNSSVLAAIDMGAAEDYVILAKTAANNSATSTVTGDIGLSPAATS